MSAPATKPLGVGIIGASAGRGWAKESHVPAVQKLAGLELAAVASGSQEKGEAAAKAFGASKGYGSGLDLIRDPAVEIVVVAVKVPDHRDLVLAALAAGKHVYCEWPLGRNVDESVEMAEAARSAGVHTAIGLQTRANPAVRQAREKALAAGTIGRILSARVLSTTMAFGPKVEAAMVFAEKPESGLTPITIQGAHTLDLAVKLLGPFRDVSALATTQFPDIELGKEATPGKRVIADHLLVMSRLADSDGALSLEVAGGRPEGETPFRFEVTGEKGSLLLHGGAARGFQSGRLRLSVNGEEQTVDEGEVVGLPDEAANVAGVYAALRDDIARGSLDVLGFDHAVYLARLVEDVLASSQAGTRKSAGEWPRE